MVQSLIVFSCILYPWYKVYRGYIGFGFSVIMFVCLSVNFFFRQIFLKNNLGSEIWFKA